jgi:TonB family protein
MEIRYLARTGAIAGAVALAAAACVRPGGPATVTPAPVPIAAPEKVDPAVCYLHDRSLAVPPDNPGPPVTGSIFGRDSALAPADAGPLATPGPALDKEIIRRIIRRHINEVKACYEAELVARPTLGGTISVEFLIQPSGFVSQTRVAKSTMGAPAVDDCIARAMCGWQFPRPLNGGSIVITYPYKLTPTSDEGS